MIKKNLLTAIFLLFFITNIFSQTSGANSEPESITILNTGNDANHPCISTEEYKIIEQRCTENSKIIESHSNPSQNKTNAAVSLAWPLKANPSLKDCSYYHISAYVDQNATAGVFKDFNCGTNTYDGHRGTDISIGPFNFYKMDNDLVEVVAAASGIIYDKHDGEFDKNCGSNTLTANYVIIQHADGSRALYWHMKKNSITSKAIGASVVAGEKLGVVGSSGNSSGPHLHFEVWSGNNISTKIDPYSGTCNTLNSVSWWTAQKPYKETSIVKATVHTTDIVLPPCPNTEILNESDYYVVPFQGAGLAAGYAKFYIFIRDEVSGTIADMSILNPDGSTHLNWTYTSTTNNKLLMWGFSKKLPTVFGKYTFKATYNGTTCTSTFEVSDKLGVENEGEFSKAKIFPNPSHGNVSVEIPYSTNQYLEIFDLLGNCVAREELTNGKSEINLNIVTGLYLYQITNNSKLIKSGKLMIL